jgi:hypothetical protein
MMSLMLEQVPVIPSTSAKQCVAQVGWLESTLAPPQVYVLRSTGMCSLELRHGSLSIARTTAANNCLYKYNIT